MNTEPAYNGVSMGGNAYIPFAKTSNRGIINLGTELAKDESKDLYEKLDKNTRDNLYRKLIEIQEETEEADPELNFLIIKLHNQTKEIQKANMEASLKTGDVSTLDTANKSEYADLKKLKQEQGYNLTIALAYSDLRHKESSLQCLKELDSIEREVLVETLNSEILLLLQTPETDTEKIISLIKSRNNLKELVALVNGNKPEQRTDTKAPRETIEQLSKERNYESPEIETIPPSRDESKQKKEIPITEAIDGFKNFAQGRDKINKESIKNLAQLTEEYFKPFPQAYGLEEQQKIQMTIKLAKALNELGSTDSALYETQEFKVIKNSLLDYLNKEKSNLEQEIANKPRGLFGVFYSTKSTEEKVKNLEKQIKFIESIKSSRTNLETISKPKEKETSIKSNLENEICEEFLQNPDLFYELIHSETFQNTVKEIINDAMSSNTISNQRAEQLQNPGESPYRCVSGVDSKIINEFENLLGKKIYGYSIYGPKEDIHKEILQLLKKRTRLLASDPEQNQFPPERKFSFMRQRLENYSLLIPENMPDLNKYSEEELIHEICDELLNNPDLYYQLIKSKTFQSSVKEIVERGLLNNHFENSKKDYLVNPKEVPFRDVKNIDGGIVNKLGDIIYEKNKKTDTHGNYKEIFKEMLRLLKIRTVLLQADNDQIKFPPVRKNSLALRRFENSYLMT
ncbi:MAG: hypothetical protein HRT47_00070 [Candidatus Caenarcaniphilales bacterium]|nr:hypothetical protein [Candidatus Caenarcaniphilales bacterium]